MGRLASVCLIVCALGACTPFQQGQGGGSKPSGQGASATPTGPILRALWILSPVGLRLRDQPNPSGRQLVTVPQGAQVTATAYQGNDSGWYQVDYQGNKGWIAARDLHSVPPQDLVTTHPQLSYSNQAAGYYFLYPATWQISDRGVDVEVDQVPPSTGVASPPIGLASPPSGAASPPSGPPQQGMARMIVHQAQDIGQLGNIPTSSGSNLGQSDWEIGGITAIKHTYQLTGGGLEGDIKVKYSSDKALLVTFRGATQQDLDVWTEILESFGFSVPPPGAPVSPSPVR